MIITPALRRIDVEINTTHISILIGKSSLDIAKHHKIHEHIKYLENKLVELTDLLEDLLDKKELLILFQQSNINHDYRNRQIIIL